MGEVRANAWLLRPALDFVNILLIVAIVAAIGTQRLQGVEVGLLYAFIAYVARVVEPLIQITMQFSLLQQSVIAAARVNALLHEGEAPRVAQERRIDAGRVELADVSFGYDPQQPVLHDITLAIPAGDFVGIVGHTGSGKSTLLSLLLRFYAPQSGRIEIDGIPLEQIGDAQFRADIGLVPQEPFLLAADAYENIDMGRGLAGGSDHRGREGRARARFHRAARAGLRDAARRGRRPAVIGAKTADRRRARVGRRGRASCSSTRPRRASTARPSSACRPRCPSCTRRRR